MRIVASGSVSTVTSYLCNWVYHGEKLWTPCSHSQLIAMLYFGVSLESPKFKVDTPHSVYKQVVLKCPKMQTPKFKQKCG